MSINSNSSHLSPSHIHGNIHHFWAHTWKFAESGVMLLVRIWWWNNSVFPLSAYKPTHNPQFLQLLWWRANARNVSFFSLYASQFMFSTQLLTLNYLLLGEVSYWSPLGVKRLQVKRGAQCHRFWTTFVASFSSSRLLLMVFIIKGGGLRGFLFIMEDINQSTPFCKQKSDKWK